MAKKLDHEEFILKVIETHGVDNLDLSKVTYKNARTLIDLRCIKHNNCFSQMPITLLRGSIGCKLCYSEKLSLGSKRSNEYFISKIVGLYGDLFNTEDISILNGDNITLNCKIHGKFTRSFTSLKRGSTCPDCMKNSIKSGVRKDTPSFIFNASNIHGERYDYSNTNYINCNTELEIFCKVCNKVFLQKPKTHLSGKGCPSCWTLKNRESKLYNRRSNEDVDIQCKKLYGDSLDLSESNLTTSNEKMRIYCKICQDYFYQYKGHLLRGVGCQKCSRKTKQSKPEKLVSTLLDELNIKYEREKGFTGCVHKNVLKFDFFIPSLNLCIEYQGEQHFKPVSIFGGETSFKEQLIKDSIKRQYCKDNNIGLLEIDYTHDINSMLKTYLSSLTSS